VATETVAMESLGDDICIRSWLGEVSCFLCRSIIVIIQ
jgi:hypothetical protein